MIELADIVLAAGKATVELSLFVLLPIMVVMMLIMRLLEAKELLGRVVRLFCWV